MQRRRKVWRGLIGLAALLSSASLSDAAEIKVIVANAIKEAYEPLVASFEKASGHKVLTTFSGTEATFRRVSGGEVFDIVLIGSEAIDRLIGAGKLAKGSRVDIARSGVGVAVRSGLPKPNIASGEALKAAVLNANSVAYSAGPSGEYVAELLKKLGVADQISTKVKRPSSGAEVAGLLVKGEVDFGFGQVSEFLNVKGLTDLGPLPPEIQHVTIYAAAGHIAASSQDAAHAFLKHLTQPAATPIFRQIGMDPG